MFPSCASRSVIEHLSSRFIYAAAGARMSCLFKTAQYSIVCLDQLAYPFICQWTLELRPTFGGAEGCCCAHVSFRSHRGRKYRRLSSLSLPGAPSLSGLVPSPAVMCTPLKTQGAAVPVSGAEVLALQTPSRGASAQPRMKSPSWVLPSLWAVGCRPRLDGSPLAGVSVLCCLIADVSEMSFHLLYPFLRYVW